MAEVKIKTKEGIKKLRLFIVGGNRQPLLGREWMRALNYDWIKILHGKQYTVDKIIESSNTQNGLKAILDEFPAVFLDTIGKIEGVKASLHSKNGANPTFLKARPLPFSIRDTMEEELKNMVDKGILVKVERSEWATPIIPVRKTGKKVRLCGDYKLIINKGLLIDDFPLPTIDELFANMSEGKKFSKLDLAQAYLQMEIREKDQHLLTLNTHMGLYQPTRLMYGVASATAIFQREITSILQGIPGVTVFLDDVKITAPNDTEYLQRLREVLKRFNDHNMRVNLKKCEFLEDKIEYCGYMIDKKGIHKLQGKIDAIENMPRPENKEQVRALLGLVNYYGRFMKNLSTHMYPINNLLKDEVAFERSPDCEKAFAWMKAEMQSKQALTHYDTKLPLILATDASPYGVGAVLSHVYADGSENPIQYASQTLTKTQQIYTQIDKEAYAVIFGIKKFFKYLYGRKLILVTDIKPLTQIWSPQKGLPTLSAMRMQHYAVFLESFNFEIL
ncbi:uncharacterized protein LOC121588066 isoform X2 [Anopheles merus]|uniref:uncharacterized protein LOC121588066 isoform X2 n=1 Tax=Anopheles merus TaxID=30066 RepID=UPI001BE47BB6|nr:uncharacterized protein LOC121588066 isoform X2 [Anopheles merus]